MKVNNKKVDGFLCFFGTSSVTLLENILARKGLIRSGKGAIRLS